MTEYDNISIEQLDAVYAKVHCERGIAMELSEHFTFSVPNAKFSPKFKNKIWDGKIRLFNTLNQTIYCGLVDHIKEFCKDRNYAVNEITSFDTVNYSLVEATDFCKTLKLPF